ncbi:hypothetical protein COV61_02735, partial [Candidatus Micrarchaeota archaeon CG11_big_fil_rev_8_21_14_0_20_47_5]
IAQPIFLPLLLFIFLRGGYIIEMEIEVRVCANARKFGISQKDGIVRIRVCAKAQGGEANAELVKKLGNSLGCRVEIVNGLKSKTKRLHLSCEEQELEKLLLDR